MSVTVRAPAKINLQLGVGPVRPDGYHPLATVYQAIGLYDDVTVTEAEQWSVRMKAHERIDIADLPPDEDNIALKAGWLLAEHHQVDRSAEVVIEKGIPIAGGLAGGSADAAATLLALDRLWDLKTPDEELLKLAGQLGSDVPFALIGGTAIGGGRGELVTSQEDNGTWWWVVVESEIGLSTPAVYAEFDRIRGSDVPNPEPREDLLGALISGDPDWLATCLTNDLTGPALSLRPDLDTVLKDGMEVGALGSLISGSGPTCLFLCRDMVHASAVRLGMVDRGHQRVTAATAPVAGAHIVEYS